MSYPRVHIIDLRPEAQARRRCARRMLAAVVLTALIVTAVFAGSNCGDLEPAANAAACDEAPAMS